ncbi:MAG: alpha/beta fold hydrolase [Planctomycetota bacterium]
MRRFVGIAMVDRRWPSFGVIASAALVALALGLASPEHAAGQSSAPEPKEIKLTTDDGVTLGATYYPSRSGRDAVPVVMLHDFKQNRAVFRDMAYFLQDPPDPSLPSHAVVTVDLRGHGESTTAVVRGGGSVEISAARLSTRDFAAMVLGDMEAVRRELVSLNDQGQLNLNKLTLIGAGMGANVALNWAAKDWATPRLASRKQGQDVKALVLLSPKWKSRGLPVLRALKQPGVQQQVSFFIAFGRQDRKQKKDAETIYKNLERFHPEPPRDQVREKKSLFMVPVPSGLSGTDLLNRTEGLPSQVADFIDARVSSKDFEWVGRKKQ